MEGAAEFARCVGALRPWLGTLVFAGGWAHRLHRDHALAQPPEYQPIRTLDRKLTPEDVCLACWLGLQAVLDPPEE